MRRILIIGDGRIARAVSYYAKKLKIARTDYFIPNGTDIKKADLLIGALPAGLGEKSLKFALRFKKNLIDLADLDVDFYLAHKEEILKKNITVVPGCGFCPGLVNFILGQEISANKNIREVEVKAGSLSPQKCYFPFLWCFEDLVLEFMLSSVQIISGKKKKFPAFGGYQREKFFGIEAESYYGQSGFENLLGSLKFDKFTYSNIRPLGFRYFFQYLKNYGFFGPENILNAKEKLEARQEDNMSIAQIKVARGARYSRWLIRSFSKKAERLNSMQKITSLFTMNIARVLMDNEEKISRGVLFCEELGGVKRVFFRVKRELEREGIYIKRKEFKS